MWNANFEDGSSVNSKQIFWKALPRTKKLAGLQLTHNFFPKVFVSLTDYDRYYFAQEAVSVLGGSSEPTTVAQVIGAHNLRLGVGIEVRLSHTGNISVKTYSVESFKYSPEILREGVGVGEARSGTLSGAGNAASA